MRRIYKQLLANDQWAVVERMMKGNQKMGWNYDPEDANSSWPAADYEATIERVVETVSKKTGDPMLDIHFLVYGMDGQTQTVHEFITAPPKSSGRKGSLFKLRALAMIFGVYDAFKNGTLDPQSLRGQNLIVKLDRDVNPQFGDRNTIVGYEELKRPLAASTKAAPAAVVDEEVPF